MDFGGFRVILGVFGVSGWIFGVWWSQNGFWGSLG